MNLVWRLPYLSTGQYLVPRIVTSPVWSSLFRWWTFLFLIFCSVSHQSWDRMKQAHFPVSTFIFDTAVLCFCCLGLVRKGGRRRRGEKSRGLYGGFDFFFPQCIFCHRARHGPGQGR